MLELSNVNTYYGDIQVLRDVSFEVKAGSVVALMGRNGMGKTTTISTIIGFNPPRRGTIHFNGTNIAGLPSEAISKAGIALVPQGRMIFPSLSVAENLTIGARGTNSKDAWTLDRVYEQFPILEERANQKGNLLSGGEQQMLAIARAMMTNPKLILMDEPSEGLAPIIVEAIADIISRLKQANYSILLVEQDISLALDLADYIYIMSKGSVVYRGTPAELGDNEDIKNKYLGIET
jgi:branched-chain amino acid transport system ATP-binding protein